MQRGRLQSMKAITVVLPETAAMAMLDAARASGDYLGHDTIRLTDHIILRQAVFESLAQGVPLIPDEPGE